MVLGKTTSQLSACTQTVPKHLEGPFVGRLHKFRMRLSSAWRASVQVARIYPSTF